MSKKVLTKNLLNLLLHRYYLIIYEYNRDSAFRSIRCHKHLKNIEFLYTLKKHPEAYLGTGRTSTIKLFFAKIVNSKILKLIGLFLKDISSVKELE